MKQILKILSKFWLSIILVIVLLFIQANCDLALPEYTSNIINVGISSNGIESYTPEVIRESKLNEILKYTDKKNEILKNYKLVKKNDKNYNYKILSKENIYVLKGNINLDEYFKEPLLMDYAISNKLDTKTNIDNITDTMIKEMLIKIVKEEYLVVGANLEEKEFNYILSTGLKMILISFVIMFITVITSYLSSKIGSKFARNLRSSVVNKVMSYSNKEFDTISTASLITRSTNDITQIQMLITMLLRIVIYAPIIGFGALSKVSGSPLEWIIGVAILTLLSLIIIIFSFAIPKFKKLQTLIDRLNLVSREILSGIPVIRSFSNERYEEKKFDKANTDLTKTNLFVNKIMTFMMPSMMFIMYGMQILIVWVGSKNVDLGNIMIGDLFAFISYSMQIIMSFLMISMVSIILPRAWISVKRIKEVFILESSIKNSQNPKKLKGDITIEFKDVCFKYPSADLEVLKNINFIAKPGTITAFIGSTGCGKSTLINLIPRFFDITSGEILVNGINIKDIDLNNLRSNIGYVPQKGLLFSGTIKENIMFGKKIKKEKLDESINISASKEFIDKLDKKYNYEISQGGINLSGGQKQRLSIARAISIDPKIYIFDDAFSALDYKTDYLVRKKLKKITKNSTVFIVAQRISTIMNADQIVVLDNGKVVGIGTHDELIKKCKVYKEITYSQISKEELK